MDNPLCYLEEILYDVFQRLSLYDLFVCTMVCRLWNYVAMKIKMKWISIKISSAEDIDGVRSLLVDKKKQLKMYQLTLAYNVGNSTFLRPKLFQYLLDLIIGPYVITSMTFAALLEDLTSLKRLETGHIINKYRFCPINDGLRILVFNNIKRLKFDSSQMETNFCSIFKTFPKLERLEIFNLIITNSNVMRPISFPSLLYLSITCPSGKEFKNEHVNMLSKFTFESLEVLLIFNISRSVNVQRFRELIQIPSLRMLKLGNRMLAPRFQQYFPVHLPNLTFLSVDMSFARDLAIVCSQLPKLESIELHINQWSKCTDIFRKKFKAIPTVTVVWLHWIDSEAVSPLSIMFPCITSLCISCCTDKILRAICLYLVNLDYLKFSCSSEGDVTEEGLTGIPTARLTAMPPNLGRDDQVKWLNKLRKFPAITNLKKLKYLDLSKSKLNSITSVILYGILYCPSLLEPVLPRCDLHSDVIEALNSCIDRNKMEANKDEIVFLVANHLKPDFWLS